MISLQVAQIQKSYCASFYEQPEIRLLLGDILHPGGTDLSLELANRIQIGSGDIVLDIACGTGSTSSLLTQKCGCRMVGVDLSSKSSREAHERARALTQQNSFLHADGEHLPFAEAAFDAVISECSLCTFTNKEFAAKEIFRVLNSHGRASISDIFLEGRLPEQLQDTLYKFLCIADARSRSEYERLFTNAGFHGVKTYDRSEVLLDLLGKLKKVLFAAELLVGLKKLAFAPDKVQKAKSILQEVTAAAGDGVIGYGVLIVTKTMS